jgi:hypothetical protein
LKQWVARHPEAFRAYGLFANATPEATLLSGDEVDALFANRQTFLAIEVKAADAPEDEIRRGIYQCVKYRAVLRAMQLAAGQPPNARAILVTQITPTEAILELAEMLSVTALSRPDLERRCRRGPPRPRK